jgi:hypothetical protein
VNSARQDLRNLHALGIAIWPGKCSEVIVEAEDAGPTTRPFTATLALATYTRRA